MDIPLVFTKDTHGALTYDILKIDIEAPCVTVKDVDDTLKLSYNNINYLSIPGLDVRNASTKFFLTYTGSNGSG